MADRISWDDKVALNPKPDIDPVNKVTDADMNEIKSVVNSHADDIEAVENSKADIDASNAERDEWRNVLYATEKIVMTGNLALSETTARNLLLDPDGSDRSVDLTDTEGLPVFIRHEGSANQIDVGGVVTLWPGDSCAILYDGTNPVLVGHTVASGVQTIYEGGGTPFAVTDTDAKVTLNGNPIELTLPHPGKWRVQGTLVVKGAGLTTDDNQLSVKVHQAGVVVPDSLVDIYLNDITTSDQHIAVVGLPPVYVDWSVGQELVSLYAQLANSASAGSLVITQASLVAERVGP